MSWWAHYYTINHISPHITLQLQVSIKFLVSKDIAKEIFLIDSNNFTFSERIMRTPLVVWNRMRVRTNSWTGWKTTRSSGWPSWPSWPPSSSWSPLSRSTLSRRWRRWTKWGNQTYVINCRLQYGWERSHIHNATICYYLHIFHLDNLKASRRSVFLLSQWSWDNYQEEDDPYVICWHLDLCTFFVDHLC